MPDQRRYPYAVLDVFTERALEGNGLAVLHDADDLTDDEMLALARETRLSETSFVQAASRDGADYRNRIFTIGGEVPFAGHPSLGVAVAVALARGATDARYVQETGAGMQPVDVRLSERGWYASILQERAEFGPELEPFHVLAAVGLVPGDAHRELPPQIVSTGLETMIAPVLEPSCLERIHPDFELIDALRERYGATNLYLVSVVEEGKARARMFSSLLHGGEDPATGSAAGPLCAYLAKRGRGDRVEIVQGVEMGRPSRLFAAMEGERPRVGGGVVPVIEGTVLL